MVCQVLTGFKEILEIEPDIVDRPDAIEIEDVKGTIEFQNVSFKYNDTTDNVFKNINLR